MLEAAEGPVLRAGRTSLGWSLQRMPPDAAAWSRHSLHLSLTTPDPSVPLTLRCRDTPPRRASFVCSIRCSLVSVLLRKELQRQEHEVRWPGLEART